MSLPFFCALHINMCNCSQLHGTGAQVCIVGAVQGAGAHHGGKALLPILQEFAIRLQAKYAVCCKCWIQGPFPMTLISIWACTPTFSLCGHYSRPVANPPFAALHYFQMHKPRLTVSHRTLVSLLSVLFVNVLLKNFIKRNQISLQLTTVSLSDS